LLRGIEVVDYNPTRLQCLDYQAPAELAKWRDTTPDGLKNQIDGKVIQTVSRTLLEELTWDHSMVTSLDWASYPIITFPDVPEVVTDLIDRPNEKPWGAGEPSAAVIPSAISNAVFDAIGVRLRSAPFTSAKVKAAMRSI